ncbi:MAG: WYL domain-containing protein [Lachnospiraceae bacterium]|nr:WYL domain-containing protein [Lachnospiraceae bacterium]
MAKGANQKLKIMYLMKILLEQTDEDHSISMSEILSALNQYGISAERKSIYNDLESLRQFGMDIIGEQRDRMYYYHVGKRQFELAELKLLVDSVQSAKFITAKKANELIKKIESLASKHEASQLQRQVYVANRIKTMNGSIYYNVDEIHGAIAGNKQIRFQYFQWNVKKEMELRHDGAYYQVSPWALSWDDENYYLIAYDSAAGKIKHFRVDKMLRIESVKDRREGREQFKEFDMAVYARKMFGMYGGREENVKLRCENNLVGAIIDRFGKEVSIMEEDEQNFSVNVKVAVSNQFIHWVMALGAGAKIVGPESVVAEVKEEINRLAKQYE